MSSTQRAIVRQRRTLHRGKFLEMTAESVELPDGRAIELELVRHPGAAAVVPLDADGNVLLVRQYRHAADGWLLEVPAGKLDAGESAEDCARRELEEEAGVRAAHLRSLGFIWPSPGFTDEVIHLFLAENLTSVPQRLEHDELLTVERRTLAEAVSLAAGGGIDDAKSVTALLRAARLLER